MVAISRARKKQRRRGTSFKREFPVIKNNLIPQEVAVERRALLTACAVDFAFSANSTNHTPMLSVLRETFGLSQARSGLHTIAIFITHALMQVAGGRLAERFGSLRVVILTLALVAIANTALGLSVTFGQLLLFKALAGIGTGARHG